ncbi:alpha-L-fucosidase [Sediminibacterium soli]|uniref:alpha-L-fucosidase n=1 Tax=Sediminibacterium soli TaxID=2698829 RepID=UPI0013798659|nr:alpha-L-fucosidase [Sediminibacterium soli]NCI47406.1 alpha-L-fucosidase [Sediminibacterium soli]
MKKCLVCLCSLLVIQSLCAQELSKDERMKWWREARFGMFIHWGVYAQWAGVYNGHEQLRGGAEWIMNRSKIPVAEYQAKAKEFNPRSYDPDAWVRMAKDAGMKYIVITSKHHDGFALFKSAASKWNVVDATAYGKDLLAPLAAACKKYGIRLGFYYSHAQDWNNPGGAASRKAASEGWLNPDSAKIDAYTKEHNGHWDPAQETSSFSQYIDQVAVPQVKEILSNYGDISVLWWDTPTNMTDEAAKKLQTLLKLQPNIITNDRLKRPNFPGDTKTPEQKIPKVEELDGQDWETCMTMNGTWGFRTSDTKWKSTETLVRNLIDIASKGGNYLLNIGPKADGTFPEASIERLKEVGSWMKKNGEAIYATKASPLPPLTWGRATRKDQADGTTIYLSVFDWPVDGRLLVPGLSNAVSTAVLLEGGRPLAFEQQAQGLALQLPPKPANAIATVIRLQVKGNMSTWFPPKQTDMKSGSIDAH